MKIKYINNLIIIYLKDIYISSCELSLRKISEKIYKYYNISLTGFYNANVYIDKKYGTIIEFIPEGRDLYFNKLELNIRKENSEFLYEIDDIINSNVKYFYMYNNKYYIDNYIDDMEISNIIYKNTNLLRESAKKVSFCK